LPESKVDSVEPSPLDDDDEAEKDLGEGEGEEKYAGRRDDAGPVRRKGDAGRCCCCC
jgi:hypothetical protein